jgi:hypothetical protein
MQIFNFNDKVSIVCQALDTRTAFKHVAQVMVNGREFGNSVKICYVNRTWEKFTFESVLHKAIEATTALTDAEKEQFKKQLNDKHGY